MVTFIWKGKPLDEDRIHGVGFAIKTALLANVPDLPLGVINLHAVSRCPRPGEVGLCSLPFRWLPFCLPTSPDCQDKSLQTLRQEVLFADHCTLVPHTDSDLQTMLSGSYEASKLFGLTTSLTLSKTDVLHQPSPTHAHLHPELSSTTYQCRAFQAPGKLYIM
ncbi:hypothetical protein ElyMa_000097800 [Elysia marginata]|uniref:Uncharacterized protein n=1 Tax=Elysia marginata TaxID=1093978 RepID=A0AAV4EL75_9GAST|nr:hypothetical protein ElyMa_000097800 [Elysia marginata]